MHKNEMKIRGDSHRKRRQVLHQSIRTKSRFLVDSEEREPRMGIRGDGNDPAGEMITIDTESQEFLFVNYHLLSFESL
jgi:hypothetical protein